jgi:hypothetical protein
MSRVVVQIGYAAKNGGFVPLATSRDPSLTQVVARHIMGELSQVKFGDEQLNIMAAQERNHLAAVMKSLSEENQTAGSGVKK